MYHISWMAVGPRAGATLGTGLGFVNIVRGDLGPLLEGHLAVANLTRLCLSVHTATRVLAGRSTGGLLRPAKPCRSFLATPLFRRS